MTDHFLKLLRCPACVVPLLPISDLRAAPCDASPDALLCPSCNTAYPCLRGIPRFVTSDHYTGSFSHQWNRYEVQRAQEDEETFRTKTGLDPAALRGQLVLDGGCGSGRYAAAAARHGARVVAVDLSLAVEKAAEVCRTFSTVQVLQADVLKLPLASEQFDFVFSLGVIHHSPEPRRAFHELARRLKPGGRMAVWVYRRNTFVQEALNRCLRGITTRMPVKRLETCCRFAAALGAVPLLNKSVNKLVNFSNHPDRELRVCDTFDWYSPRYQSHHPPEEIRAWFEEEGFENIEELPPAKTGRFYRWAFAHHLILGSGANLAGIKRASGRRREK